MNPATPQGKGQRIGYVRVSSADQNTARQLEGVGLDRVFIHLSGKDMARPRAFAREGCYCCRYCDHWPMHNAPVAIAGMLLCQRLDVPEERRVFDERTRTQHVVARDKRNTVQSSRC